MRISIFWKLLGMVAASVLLLGISVFFTTKHFVTDGFDQESVKNIENFQSAMKHEIRDKEAYYLEVARRAAQDHQLASAVYSGDAKVLAKYAEELMQAGDIEFVTFTDTQGEVILRGHSDVKADSVLSQQNVSKALEGEPVAGAETLSEAGMSLLAAHPVRIFERTVGVITLGMSFESNIFVDAIQEKLGVEATIFQGDTRLSTTIRRDGQRVVGTEMTNPEVTRTVLTDSETFQDRNNIIGRWYDTAYWPLVNLQGETIGMYFLGTDREIIESAQKTTLASIMWVTLLIGALMLLAGFFLARTLAGRIVAATNFASRVADGNLDETLSIKSADETGVLAESLNKMVANLKKMIKESEAKTAEAVRESEKARLATREANEAREQAEMARTEGKTQAADQLEGIVGRIGSASEELSAQVEHSTKGAEDQKHRITETATAMEQMNATVLEVAKNASNAANGADKAKNEAGVGARIVDKSIKSIARVQEMSSSVKESLDSLGDRAKQIGSIMNVIDDIADQTNLLALNAAIEAARAGDAGRGFAVVADEVRKLAEKTMTATKEVGESIATIQQGARDNIQGMDKAVLAVEEATQLVNKSGEVLENIVNLAQEVATQVSSIATATEEQSSTSEQVNRSIDEINRIATDTADAMGQSARAINELAGQAGELQALIEKIKNS
ncbi:MAG: methyl-accepting chemotaxis protein [Desulfonatronovibrio sp.]